MTGPENDEIFHEACRLLEPDGWHLEIRLGASEFAIDLSHVLTTPTTLGFLDADETERNLAALQQILQRREFEIIRERPISIPHASLIRSMRETATANKWNDEIVAILARMLANHDLLTTAEADWLAMAGPAWNE
jgi:hypothetical protein